MGPSLAVILPTLGEEELLPRLLARLMDGEGDDCADRVIVADGGSSDRTCKIAREAGCEVVECDAGRGRQLARGAERAQEDILLFLHADTVPAKGALSALRARYSDDAVQVTSMSQEIEATGVFYRAVERFADFRSARLGMVYGDSGLGVRRSVYAASGGFQDLTLFEDVVLSKRLRQQSRIWLVSEARLLVSARRWKKEGALSCTLRNWMLLGAFLLGRDPERLARHYTPHSRKQ